MKIDVIVPVYRGLEETRRCIESVRSSTNSTPFELVIINDASPEQEIHAWLNELAGEPSITVLTNERNLGFVGTVNRGMRLHGDRDVVLLNSDTEVANDWLDRLAHWTKKIKKIGTITPFSNNATICSYPQFCQSNDLPSGMSVAEMDALFADVNDGEYLEVPTGVGFCMYITRACLNDVGYFDEETFGRGYGEENDFCMRAVKRGWKNILAGNVFVFHEGSVSFNEESLNLQKIALDKLLDKHPEYTNIVSKWVQADPPALMRRRVDVERLKKSGKPGVLFIGHGLGGGTYTHIHELVNIIEEKANLFLLEPGNRSIVLKWINSGESFRAEYRLPDEWPLLIKALTGLAIHRIHYHHTMGHNPIVFELPKALALPYDITLHDYYFICPQVHLNDASGRYCGFPERSDCDACLAARPAPGKVTIHTWRHNFKSFIEAAERVFCPSKDVMERFRAVFTDGKYIYAPHPAAHLPLPSEVRGLQVYDRPIRVACLGALPPIKGAEVLEAAAVDARKRRLPVEYHLIGFAHRALIEKPKSNLVVHGKYFATDLPSIVDRLAPDLFWFPAQVPETFSFTLNEVLQLGYPVVTSNLGAFPERLAGRPNSWVMNWRTSAREWNEIFSGFREKALPAKEWSAEKEKAFDYSEGYLDQPVATSSSIPLSHEWFPEAGIHQGASSDSRVVRLLRFGLERSVLLGKMYNHIPLIWRKRAKEFLGW